MSSQQGKVKCAGDRCRQLRACVLDRCTDAALVAQYKSFQKRMKAERNAFAGEHIDDTQLQENLRQLRAEKDECACRIEASIRQSGSQALERVEQGSLALARETFAEADCLEQAAKRLRQTATRQEELGHIAGSVGRVCLAAAREPTDDESEEEMAVPRTNVTAWEDLLRDETPDSPVSSTLWAARAKAHAQRAKDAKTQERAAGKRERQKHVSTGRASMNTPQKLVGEGLLRQIQQGYRRAFFGAELEQEVLQWMEEQLQAEGPFEVTMAGPQPRKLNHMKLMYGTPDADGLLPMYNFGILKEDLRKTAAMPSLLRRCAQAIHNVYGGSEPNSCLVNVYRSGKDSAGKHQDQNGSGGGGQYEFKESVFIARFGAESSDRDLSFHSPDGTEDIAKILMQSRDLYVLTGPVNISCLHSVPPMESRGLTITLSFRFVSNRIDPEGNFRIVNGKRESLNEQEQQLLKLPKSELARRLAGIPTLLPEHRGGEGLGKRVAKRRRPEAEEAPASAGAASPASSTSLHGAPAGKHLVLSMPGPELVDLMLTEDGKIMDNGKWKLKEKHLPCWVYPLVGARGKKKDWNWRNEKWATEPEASKELAEKLRSLPVKEAVGDWYGCIPGALWVKEVRKADECNGHEWAFGPNCLVVEKFHRFQAPVPIQKRGGARPWYEMNDEEWQKISQQIPDAPPVYHDLSVLDAPPARTSISTCVPATSADAPRPTGDEEAWSLFLPPWVPVLYTHARLVIKIVPPTGPCASLGDRLNPRLPNLRRRLSRAQRASAPLEVVVPVYMCQASA